MKLAFVLGELNMASPMTSRKISDSHAFVRGDDSYILLEIRKDGVLDFTASIITTRTIL